ncbi:MAG: PAS domain S-box protein, partial [Bacteroidota bacterium]
MEHFNKSELIDTLFNNASEGIVLADAKGIISLVNPAAARMFGYDPSELIGQAIETLVPDQLRKKHVGNREQFQGQTQSRPMGVGVDLFARAKDARLIPVEISLSQIMIRGERYTVAFIIDITVRKEIERSVLEKQSELERVAQALIATNEGLEK